MPTVSKCGLCGLCKKCISPRMPVTGKGKKKILFVAEAPGKDEDKNNEQLIGKAGKRLRRTLKSLGVDLDIDCWKTNAVICRPPENKIEDSMIEVCRPNLFTTIKELEPNLIVLLGRSPVLSLIEPIWDDSIGALKRWEGMIIPSQKPNAWIAITYHPSYLNREDNRALDVIFKNDLRRALKKCKSKPWDVLPDYESRVEIITNTHHAVSLIKEITKANKPTAVDYEANCLKPEYNGARIKSCSMCNDKRTISYLWYGDAIAATDEFLRSPVPKIASNMKFEERWTRFFLRHSVNNWFWDTMLAAHVIDSRSDITSIKFQSFILLGAVPYDRHIKPYLTTTNKNHINRIDELPISELLLYGGLDALYEYEVSKIQRKIVRRRPALIENGIY